MRSHPTGELWRAGYDPVVTDCIEAGKVEAAKLPPGAVIVTAMRLSDGTTKEFINWLKTEGYKFPVIAIVDNLNTDAVDVMRGGGAVDVVQRLALDKQLMKTGRLLTVIQKYWLKRLKSTPNRNTSC